MKATLLLFMGLASCLAACSSEYGAGEHGADETEPAAGETATAIINGVNDTIHEAVVTVYDEQGGSAMLCSGTVVKVDAEHQIGYVLTAGHCAAVPPKYIYVGDDFQSHATLRFEVIDYQKHPSYDGSVTSSYDFALIRFAGADATTPTMPVLPPAQDTLGEKSVVTCVGFGRTNTPPASSINTVRQSIDRSLSATSPTKLSYSLSTGGICNGDSGGPALLAVGKTEYVAGVHSYVTGNCDGVGVSGRISAAYDWVNSVLSEPAPAATCDVCTKRVSSGNGACRKMDQACLADANCGNYSRCLAACSEDACRSNCDSKYPLGVGPYNASRQCACSTECASACSGTALCESAPKCGYAASAGGAACATCTESACCSELAACASDGTCYDCLQKGDAPAACATNAARAALGHCRERSCAPSCDNENRAWAATESGKINPLSASDALPGQGCALSPASASPASARAFAVGTIFAVAGMLLRRRRRGVR